MQTTKQKQVLGKPEDDTGFCFSLESVYLNTQPSIASLNQTTNVIRENIPLKFSIVWGFRELENTGRKEKEIFLNTMQFLEVI